MNVAVVAVVFHSYPLNKSNEEEEEMELELAEVSIKCI